MTTAREQTEKLITNPKHWYMGYEYAVRSAAEYQAASDSPGTVLGFLGTLSSQIAQDQLIATPEWRAISETPDFILGALTRGLKVISREGAQV